MLVIVSEVNPSETPLGFAGDPNTVKGFAQNPPKSDSTQKVSDLPKKSYSYPKSR